MLPQPVAPVKPAPRARRGERPVNLFSADLDYPFDLDRMTRAVAPRPPTRGELEARYEADFWGRAGRPADMAALDMNQRLYATGLAAYLAEYGF